MITVEDCILKLEPYAMTGFNTGRITFLSIKQKWDRDFIVSVCQYIRLNRGLSTKQGEIAVKIIRANRMLIEGSGVLATEIDYLLLNPTYRIKLHESVPIAKEVRWFKDNLLVFRFSYNQSIIEELKKLSSPEFFSDERTYSFDKEYRVNVVAVHEKNIDAIMRIIKEYRISFDDEVAQFFVNATNALEQKTKVSMAGNKIQIEVNNDEFIHRWFQYLTSMEE